MKSTLAIANREIARLKQLLGQNTSALKILRADYDRQVELNDRMRRVIRSVHQQTKI